ncbi:hypothetical protein J14TS2_03650 [Bacillus sp. J14TS2]|uniref:YesL family protein n=1 Tax=Bacillus sp. J14TS2 TaxID=2807188 RepID=UPI001B0E6DC7|nr:DUF624 domain-containing protein [Bacillus sp. J14TS2]GIN69890.1 hypothetical protein J14TS2_03650 [Bacillus sp. J14TS2]
MKLFNNKIYLFLDRVSNLFILNSLWVITCIPIITFFPATAAMFSVIRQWKRKDETTVIRPFFIHFKRNFKDSFIVGLLWLPFGVLLYFNYLLIVQTQKGMALFTLIPIFLISLIYLFMSVYLFPIMVHYQVRIRDILKNSFIVSLVYFPTTFVLIGMGAILLTVLFFIPPFALIIFSCGAYMNFLLCDRLFQKIEKLRFSPTSSNISIGEE